MLAFAPGTAGRAGLRAWVALAALTLGGCGGSMADSSSTADSSADDSSPTVNGGYAPKIEPANFVASIDNPLLPFQPGTTLRLRGVAENGTTPQLDTETVTARKKQILGVACTVVRDTVSSGGKPIERTDDWYAQDSEGNVWYFGEDARDFQGGRFVKASDSWQAGVDGAKPGVVMEARPRQGESYRQEYYPGHAVDQARVVGYGPVEVPFGSFPKALITDERSALEPGVRERKFNVAGIGVVAERVVKGNRERFGLVGVSR